MIRYKNTRFNGAEDVIEDERPVHQAFNNLVFAEIGFGTRILELTETKIVCQTNVLGCPVVVEFTGLSDEMEPLYKAAAVYCLIRGERSDELSQLVIDALPQTHDGGYRPFDLVHLSDILAGQIIYRLVALLAIGIDPTTWPQGVSAEDTLAAVCLQLETDTPAPELI